MSALPLRILIADDTSIIREGLSAVINRQDDLCVIAEASNGEEAVALFRQYTPDVTLMDVRMPIMNGIEAIRQIRAEFPTAAIVVLSSMAFEDEVACAFAVGAAGYLQKDLSKEQLLTAIRSAGQCVSTKSTDASFAFV